MRFLRSGLAVAIGLVSLGLARLLGPAAPRDAAASEETRALSASCPPRGG